MDGWIKLYRKVTEDEWYFSEKFTREQAWIDLLILAAYSPRKLFIRGIEVNVEIGQVAMSVSEMEKRWSWSRNKVFRFISELQKHGKIELQKSNVINLISIVKFEKYQSDRTAKSTPKGTTNETADGTTKGTTNKEIKEDKEIKETPTNVGGKKIAAADAATLSKVRSIEERQKDFYYTLRPYVNKYPKEMLRAFFDWWSEPNRSRTKLRAELEKTWDLPRRLAIWHKKDEERRFNGTNRQSNSAEQRAADAASAVARLLAEDDARQ